ncbi:MAG: DUF3298 domain-containing protein [Clostridia bacterium]|nr:DUF3298 domain-containing protein [Clostridia bacterium]
MKKTISLIMLAAFMIFLFASCSGGDTKSEDAPDMSASAEPSFDELLHITSESFSFVEWSDDYFTVLATCEYSLPALTDECAAAYPKLAASLSKNNELMKENMASEYESNIAMALELIELLGDDFYRNETKNEFYVRRADSRALSLLCFAYSYTGGAHGMYAYYGVNYDPESGEELNLTDVIADTSLLPDAVREKMSEQCGDAEFFDDLEIGDYVAEHIDTLSWTLDYDAVTLYFSPYEIAPYAYGEITVKLPFCEYPDLVKSEYTNTPDAYAVQLVEYQTFYFDTDGDGALNTITVTGDTNEYGSYTDFMLTLDDQSVTEDIESYSWDPVLMHTGEGKNYIYMFGNTLDGFPTLVIYDVSSSQPKKVEEATLGFAAIYSGAEADDDEIYRQMDEIPTDPSALRLDTIVYDITMGRGWDVFSVDENGMPQAQNGFFTITLPDSYKVLSALSVSVIDETSGKESETMTLERGDIVTRVRTDDETYSEFCLSDNKTVVRANFKTQSDGNYFGDALANAVFAPYFPEYEDDETSEGSDLSGGQWNPVVIQRQAIFDEGCMCGVVYLGGVDREANDLDAYRAYYNSLFTESGYADDFEFLLSVPADHFVCTPDGEELYLVIPCDPDAPVAVNELYIGEENGSEGEVGEMIYESRNGAPFLLKCNASDIMPDTQVSIFAPDGETLVWSPSISLMDGRVVTVSDFKYVYDLTVYE